ncbi:MAG: 4Fe-4S dicluster domain-containing protein [bacterium]
MLTSLPSSRDEIAARIFDAGVVGAGGGGFPTHIKARSDAEIVIANGCECEPLIQSDRFVISEIAGEVVEGLNLMMIACNARRGIIAVRDGVDASGIEKELGGYSRIELVRVPNTYPAGDEHILVYECTDRVVPQGGIPIDVGVVVSNVNTLVNVRRSIAGEPVIKRVISLCGDIDNPCITEVPIGTTVGDVLRLTKNSVDLSCKVILLGGVMMGQICNDISYPIDKRTGAVVILPRESRVVQAKTLSLEKIVRQAASVCCQCTFCTEMCPRHLMGHAIQPHMIMRAVSWMTHQKMDLAGSLLCCGCGLCGLFVCPMALSPDRICFAVRGTLLEMGIRMEPSRTEVSKLRASRLVPHEKILSRTGTLRFQRELHFVKTSLPERVSIPLLQHSGLPAKPVVSEGMEVRKGQLIGIADKGGISANVHASIDGIVEHVDGSVIIRNF